MTIDRFNKKPVQSNLESIAGSIRAYHDAVFVGTGKKCDRKRNRNLVTNNIGKVLIEHSSSSSSTLRLPTRDFKL